MTVFLGSRYGLNGTALMRAAGSGQALIVDTLIKAGANVDGNDKYGTALMRAAANGHKEVFNILIEKEAKVDAVDKFGYNCLMRAAENGHDELVKLSLLKGANVNHTSTDSKKSALMLAAKNGHDNVVKTLLIAKANVNELSKDGTTALDYATENGHDNVVKTLLNVAQSHAKTNTLTPPSPPDQSIKPSTEIAGCFSCIRIAVAKMLGSNSEITRP
jgi:ankyrin repeat protein